MFYYGIWSLWTLSSVDLQPTDVIFLPLTRAWGAEGCDEAGWGVGRVAIQRYVAITGRKMNDQPLKVTGWPH